MGAHPHRGIATLTYILQGEVEHFESAGNKGKIYSGGAQCRTSYVDLMGHIVEICPVVKCCQLPLLKRKIAKQQHLKSPCEDLT